MRVPSTFGRRFAPIALAATASLAFTSLAIDGRDASATSCAMPTPGPSVENAEVIFSGQVTHVKHDGGASTLATMKVSRVYKGTVPSSIKVSGGGMKGFSGFEAGRTFLVFGRITGDEIFAHLCGATMSLPPSGIFVEGEWASWSVASLGPGEAPAKSGPPVAGATPSAPIAPSADPPPPPAPPPPPDPTSTATSTATAVPPPPDAPAEPAPVAAPPPPPAEGRGCAGCSVPAPPSERTGFFVGMALLVAGIARRTCSRRRRA